MGQHHTIYHIARADLLERIRQYSFLVVLGITILAAYFFVPPVEAGYVTLYLDEYRGIYNSAWIGGSVAISTTLFLALFGFYLVKNSIQRDKRSGVGQIIASTSVKKLHYLIGKSVSNYAVLSIIVAVVILVAIFMQMIRGEEMDIELWALLSPFLMLTLPAMSIVAAMAVLFETRQLLNGGLGNVLYFILFLIYVTGSSYIAFGPNVITSAMTKELASIKPGFSGSYSIGILVPDRPLELFEWQGVEWTGALLLQQLSLFLIALLFIIAAALLFHGFRNDAVREKQVRQKSAKGSTHAETVMEWGNTGAEIVEYERKGSRVQVSSLPPASARNSFLSLVCAEWRLMMKSASLGWYAVAGLLFVLSLVCPVTTSVQWMIWPITWIWPLVLWAGMGSRETRYQTQYLIAASPRYATRQLSAVWVSGFMLACMTGGGMAVRMILEGEAGLFIYWISAVILIPSFSLACGVLTKTNRTFEVLYMIVWYLGPLNKMPYLDFLGTRSEGGSILAVNSIYLSISIGLWMVAFGARKRLAQDSQR
ncbi:hypothetical protein D3P07_09295 [Paenibacillus sp. 1011MAR3C5]|uniref:hypothetical protein n=1 Tax=Paenibacillus sp. 1011MAR3C5 TaxID=1675787 RepID=UPI000E6CAD6C|nr:hypothetical protein [Paenibacillus sp. 1011MAR3C5]RJE90382.1 hypothetical protein D3P07_09295 [Paenibacillus sp. 1011MAR3C5]